MSRDSTASCFEFAYSDTVAENLPMSGGETMTFVGFAHRDNIATSRSRSARAFTTPEWDIDHESMQLVPTCTVRGCDRHDVDLITATYHPDGVDEHGLATNPGPEFGEWANTTPAATTAVHTHDITPTVGLEISGMTAANWIPGIRPRTPDARWTNAVWWSTARRLAGRPGARAAGPVAGLVDATPVHPAPQVAQRRPRHVGQHRDVAPRLGL